MLEKLRTCILTTTAELADQAEVWRRGPVPSPFSSYDYACAWLSINQEAKPFVLMVVNSQGQPVALAPWCLIQENGLRCLTGIGAHDAWYHEPAWFQPQYAQDAARCLADAVGAHRRHWDILRLDLRQQESGTLRQWLARQAATFEQSVPWKQHSVAEGNPWPSYLASRPVELRNILHRGQRKLDRLEHRFLVANATQVDRFLQMLFRHHLARWQAERPDWESYYEVVRAICRVGTERETIYCLGLEIGNDIAAAGLYLREGSEAYCLLLVHDPEFSRLSAGTLLQAYTLEHLFSKGVMQVNLGPGQSCWKEWFGTGIILSREVVAGSPACLRGTFRAAWHCSVKPWIKKCLPVRAS